MSYDFYHNEGLRDRLFNEIGELGSVYIIEPNLPETIRGNRNELTTIIKKIR